MKPGEVQALLDAQGVRADGAHIAATAVLLTALLEGTAERFGRLPLEAEPSGFPAEQRRRAP
jgi:hypothetical protein